MLEPDGKITVVGAGSGAYFYRSTHAPEVCKPNEPLTFEGIEVVHVATGGHFDVASWNGDNGDAYTLNVEKGEIKSSKGSKY